MTILPPRSLRISPGSAWEQIRSVVEEFPSFEITPTQIEVFGISPVVYVGVGSGRDALVRLHDLLNRGALEFPEPFPYYPHITLAQEVTRDQLDELCQLARQRWADCPARSPFRVEKATFVQATADTRWVDLADCRLAPAR